MSWAKAPTAKTVLWEISGNGLKRPSYLLGTRHVGCAKRLALSPEQSQILEKVEQVYLELDRKELEQSKNIPKATQKKTKVAGLREKLTTSQYQFVEDYFGKRELDSLSSSGIDVFSLYVKVSFETARKVYERFCPNSLTSKEDIITKAATDRRLPILGLETRKERLDIFSSSAAVSNNEVDVLLESVREANSIDSDSILAEPRFQEFIRQDEQYFYQDISKGGKKISNDPDDVRRHKLWLPRILKVMVEKPALFAFGAAHLGGNEGLIAMLESQGYNLKPVFSDLKSKGSNSDSRAKEYHEAGQRDSESSENLDALNNYDQAINIWERNGSKDGSLAQAYYDRGLLKMNYFCGFKSALADLNKAISLNSNYRLAYFHRGLLRLEKLHDYQGALLDFNKVISLDPDQKLGSSYYYYRGILKGDHLNDPKGALIDFNIHLARYPQEVESLVLRGVLKYTKLGDQSGGIADLRRAALLSRNKGDKEGLNRALTALKAINVREIP